MKLLPYITWIHSRPTARNGTSMNMRSTTVMFCLILAWIQVFRCKGDC